MTGSGESDAMCDEGIRVYKQFVAPKVTDVYLENWRGLKARVAYSPDMTSAVIAMEAFISEVPDIREEILRTGPEGTKVRSSDRLIWYDMLDIRVRHPCTLVCALVPKPSSEQVTDLAVVMVSTLSLIRTEKIMRSRMREKSKGEKND